MPTFFSNEEYADMVFVYGFTDGNASEAVREYSRRFPGRRVPDRRTFASTFRTLRETGSLPQPPVGRRDLVNDVGREEAVLDFFNENPTSSVREAESVLGISRNSVHRILVADSMHPFHISPVQELLDRDKESRVEFCDWFSEQCQTDRWFPRRILWSDEATFTRGGLFNVHNSHHWAQDNPHAATPSCFQYQFNVNVWLGVVDKHLIGPFILPRRLNAESFSQLLENQVLPCLEQALMPTNTNSIWFQMDGCPAHNGRQVTEWLNTKFPNRWIGRYGPVRWPPRSPDLTPLDFHVWGTLKSRVYSVPVTTREELVNRIQEQCDLMRTEAGQDHLRNAVDSVRRRAHNCRQQEGGHFENLMN